MENPQHGDYFVMRVSRNGARVIGLSAYNLYMREFPEDTQKHVLVKYVTKEEAHALIKVMGYTDFTRMWVGLDAVNV